MSATALIYLCCAVKIKRESIEVLAFRVEKVKSVSKTTLTLLLVAVRIMSVTGKQLKKSNTIGIVQPFSGIKYCFS